MRSGKKIVPVFVGTVILLFSGIIYGWSILSAPIMAEFSDLSGGSLSLTFTLSMIFFCLGGLTAGIMAKRTTTRFRLILAGVMFFAGFQLAAQAKGLALLYLGYGLCCGMGSGLSLIHICYDCPKVGVVTCVEKVNPKMPETVEARELREMNRRGEISGCIVEGPISYDCAVSGEIAKAKGFVSEVAGDADVLVAPNIHAGNIMGKMLLCSCGAKMAGFVAGAACPIVLTSRGSSAEEKFLSIVLSSAAAE